MLANSGDWISDNVQVISQDVENGVALDTEIVVQANLNVSGQELQSFVDDLEALLIKYRI